MKSGYAVDSPELELELGLGLEAKWTRETDRCQFN